MYKRKTDRPMSNSVDKADYDDRALERLRAKFEVDPITDCWNWFGANCGLTSGSGLYGKIRYKNKSVQAHRLSYQLLVGSIPDGLHVDHLCLNTLCVNPKHMELVTIAENNRRAVANGANRKPKKNRV